MPTALIISKKSMAKVDKRMALSPGHPLSGERVQRIPPRKIKIYNKTVRIATWNVRSLYSGKLENLDAEMHRLNIDIMGLSEVRWSGSGTAKTQNGTLYYSGGDKPKNYYGVGVLLKKGLEESVMDWMPISERVMVVRMYSSHRMVNIVQAYAPTADKSEEDLENFYASLYKALTLTKKGEITIVTGDFNAKLGSGMVDGVCGGYGLGTRNERGERMLEFCSELELAATNTFFKQHPRRLYTWKAPSDKKDNIVRNQIDYILVKKHLMRYVKKVTTLPGADINSDHNPVMMEIRINRFTRPNRETPPKRIDIGRLNNIEVRSQTADKLETRLQNISTESWEGLRQALEDTQKTDIGYTHTKKKQQWMNDDILKLMDERRLQKNKNICRYNNLNKQIRKVCREAKENWLKGKCEEIEDLQKKHDMFHLHKKIKELTNKHKQHKGILKDANNKILIGVEEKLNRWKQYVEELFNDRRTAEPNIDFLSNESSPTITKDEVRHAIKLQKNGKATGPDQVHAETLKLLAEKDGRGLDMLTSLFNYIYETGNIPEDWLKSTFITLPKKAQASQCDEYRMISLMSHVLKTFLRVIHTRIYKKCEGQMGDTQFGFRNGLGTREALFSLNVLTQRARDMNVKVYACFIDYKKAFDCIQHDKLAQILKSIGVNAEDLRFITNLYWNQTAEVRVDQRTTEQIKILRGVRQGCVLSPLLFNIYSERIFEEAIDQGLGIKINGVAISNLRFADDTVILAENMHQLQEIMNCIVHHSALHGLQINTTKTKLLIFSKTAVRDEMLYVGGRPIDQVSSYKYLGALVNENNDPKSEVLSRIEQARCAFFAMKKLFTNKHLSLQLRIRLLRCYIFPVVTYGSECWTLSPSLDKRVQAFEMYLYRRILKISWIEKIPNDVVLERMSKERELLNSIKERKLQYIGHIMRGDRYHVLRLIIEGKIEGKRSVGRRQNSWLKDLRRWFGRTSMEVFRAAASKIVIANWIANLRLERAN